MITITLEPFPEVADPDDTTGLTADAFAKVVDFLMEYGDDVDIREGA